MKCASVLRQLHAARRPVQKPDTDIFFQLPDRRGGPSRLNPQAIGCAGEAPHFRYRYENEDGFEILHFRASVLFTTERTVSSFPRCLLYLRDTIRSEYGIQHRRMASVRNYEPASVARNYDLTSRPVLRADHARICR